MAVPAREISAGEEALLELCGRGVDAVVRALDAFDEWSAPGGRPSQYALDLVADDAVVPVLRDAGLSVLSEESGLHRLGGRPGAALTAVVVPVDGSTNASRGLPWFACSICVVDASGPLASVVANLATGRRFEAVRGGGAWRVGGDHLGGHDRSGDPPGPQVRLRPSGCAELSAAVVAVSGYPSRDLGTAQFRALGAAALDLCAVAEGVLDGFTVAGGARLAPWDYLGALLVLEEAGAAVGELHDEELVVIDHEARRSIVAGATPDLCAALRRRAAGQDG